MTGPLAAAGLVTLAVALGYLRSLPYPFQFDDLLNVQGNAALAHPLDVAGIWRFRPSRGVVYLSLAWNGALTGLNPQGLRFGNLLIHVASALLVGWLAKELTRRLARGTRPEGARTARPSPEVVGLLSALLFAAHPLATQAVTYVIQRSTSLAALLELAAVAAYLRARRDGATGYWVASWGCAILAAFTKEMAIALPFLIALTEFMLRRAGAGGRPRLASFLPYLAIEPLVAAMARLPWGPAGELIAASRQAEHVSRWAYLVSEMRVIPRYLGLALWPHGQSLVHDVALDARPDLPVLAGLLTLGALSVGAWWLRTRAPLATYGWAWFLIALLPESSIFPIPDLMSEHRTYLPLAGLTFAAGSWLTSWCTGRGARWMVPAAILIALTTATHLRNRVWQSETALWSDVLRHSPGNATALNNLGLESRRAGRSSEAESYFRRSIASMPSLPDAYLNLGSLLAAERRLADAVAVLDSGSAVAPGEWRVFYSLGNASWMAGDTAAAARAYLKAVALAPSQPRPRAALAQLRGGTPPAP